MTSRSPPAQAPGAAVHALAAATLSILERHPPFGGMERDALDFLAPRLALAYYPKDAVILAPSQSDVRFLYIIQRGAVQRRAAHPRDRSFEPEAVLEEGECFPVDALLEKRPVSPVYAAAADTFCYQLAAADFHALLDRSARFRDFATSYLTSLLRDSRSLLRMQLAAAAGDEQAANRPLRDLIRREPVCCAPETPIGEALRAMERARIGSILVVAPGARLAGILTRHDVLDRIALARRGLDEPVSVVMTPDPRTLDADATSYEAALLIAREGIRHIPVVDGGTLIGIVTERDLFATQRTSMRTVRHTIADAGDTASLCAAASDIRALAKTLLSQGLGAEQLTYIISTLNDALTERVIVLERCRRGLDDTHWCWLAFGSEGRYEQTISTDQDNGIVFADSPTTGAAEVRARLVPFAQAVNRTLDECGFPICKGDIMAGNPKWCLSLGEWRAEFTRWVAATDTQELLNSVIFFDLRPIYGARDLAERLRETLDPLVRARPVFLQQLARYAVESRLPLGLLGGFEDDDPGAPGTIDLKRSGARPFTDAARVLALAAAVRHTNTAQRLRHAGAKLNLSAGEIDAATEAFYFIQSLRLRTQLLAQAGASPAPHNRINPDRLNEVDRRMLKEAFRQAKMLQSRLALDYQL